MGFLTYFECDICGTEIKSPDLDLPLQCSEIVLSVRESLESGVHRSIKSYLCAKHTDVIRKFMLGINDSASEK